MSLHTPHDSPPWNDGAEQRLFVSMSLATFLVVGVLSLFRMPDVPVWSPVLELAVRIVNEKPAQVVVPEIAPTTEPSAVAEAESELAETPPEVGQQTLQQASPTTDWESASEQVIESFLDSQVDDYGYVNPDVAEQRRRSAQQYLPGVHEKAKPIWENVELDTLGRSVLRSGDCFKVLSDPNVGSQYAFETFHSNMVQCALIFRYPKNLPWVEELRARYEYLQDPAAYDEDAGE